MLQNYKLIDLSQPIDESSPNWSEGCNFQKKAISSYKEDGYQAYEFSMKASSGTHIDSPAHFLPGGLAVHEIPIEKFFVPICIIDPSSKALPDTQIGLKELDLFERTFGPVPKGSIIIGRTGWSRFWKEPEKYRGLDAKGKRHFPTFSEEIADFLLDREVVGVGIDSLSPDPDESDFPLHHQLLNNEKYIIENLANLEALPKKGAYLFAPPWKIIGGTESPVRAIAFIQT